jgi:hypothetical protein
MLERTHKPVIHCSNCHEIFRDRGRLDVHMKSKIACDKVNLPFKQDITCEARDLIEKQWKHLRNSSDEEKWAMLYQSIYPGEAVPSPCMYHHHL